MVTQKTMSQITWCLVLELVFKEQTHGSQCVFGVIRFFCDTINDFYLFFPGRIVTIHQCNNLPAYPLLVFNRPLHNMADDEQSVCSHFEPCQGAVVPRESARQSFRPFPARQIVDALKNCTAFTVFERLDDPLSTTGNHLTREIKAA